MSLNANEDILAAGNVDPDVSYPDTDIDLFFFFYICLHCFRAFGSGAVISSSNDKGLRLLRFLACEVNAEN